MSSDGKVGFAICCFFAIGWSLAPADLTHSTVWAAAGIIILATQ